jgi:hypothetical protein
MGDKEEMILLIEKIKEEIIKNRKPTPPLKATVITTTFNPEKLLSQMQTIRGTPLFTEWKDE